MDLKTESQFFNKFFTQVNNFYATSNRNNKLVTTFKRFRAKPTLISWHPTRFTGHNSCDSGNINFCNCQVISHWYVMKGSRDFKDRSLLL